MPFSIKEVSAAETLVRAKYPHLTTARTDYDFGLSVANIASGKAIILFRPGRPEIGQSEIFSTPDNVAAALEMIA